MTTTTEQSRQPELAEVLSAAMSGAVDGLFVALPGKVESYDSVMQKANVKPLLQRRVFARDGSEGVESLPVIPDVPIAFPRGGGFFLSFPLQKGDLVLLVCCDRSIDSFVYSTGQVDVDPVDVRSHDLSDAVAIPCFYPFTRPIKCDVTQGAVFGSETGAQVRAKDAAIEITSNGLPTSTGGFVALANLLITAFNSHVHATAGTGTPSAPTVPWTTPMIASKNLKAD